MSPKFELVLGILILVIAFPGAVLVVWDGIRKGETSLTLSSGFPGSPKDIPASRKRKPGFFWFTIGVYAFGALFALWVGLRAVHEAMQELHKSTPQTILEPASSISASRLQGVFSGRIS